MANNGLKKNSEEKTRYSEDDGYDLSYEIDEEEINNLLHPDSEPEEFQLSTSPSNNTEVGRDESTALTHCDEMLDLTTPLDDSFKVDGSGNEKAGTWEDSSPVPALVRTKASTPARGRTKGWLGSEQPAVLRRPLLHPP